MSLDGGRLTRAMVDSALDELWHKRFPPARPGHRGGREPFGTVPVTVRPPDWEVSADGYRLVIEQGAMVGLAYDEWPYPWGDSRYLTAHLIADHEIRRVLRLPHECDEDCVCPRHDTPMIYWPRGDDHACQDVNCPYGHGIRAAIGAVLPA